MLRIGHLKAELTGRHTIRTGGNRAGDDVHAMIGQHTRHIAQQVRTIERLHLNLDHEYALGTGPLHVDHTFRLPLLQVQHVLAIHTMHGHALVTRDETDDLISRHRHATACQFDPDVTHTLDGDAQRTGGVLLVALDLFERQRLLLHLFVDLVAAGILHQMRNHILRGNLTVADGREHGIRVGEIEFVGDADQRFRSQQRGNRQIALAHGSCQLITAFFDGFSTSFLAEPLTNLVAGLRAFGETQPITGRPRGIGFGGQHFDGIAILQFGVQRHQASVHTGAHGAVAHFGMHGVGEVNRSGLGRQRHDLALRREHVDFRGAQIFFQGAEEFVGIRSLARPIGKLLDPFEIIGLGKLLVLTALAVGLIR